MLSRELRLNVEIRRLEIKQSQMRTTRATISKRALPAK